MRKDKSIFKKSFSVFVQAHEDSKGHQVTLQPEVTFIVFVHLREDSNGLGKIAFSLHVHAEG